MNSDKNFVLLRRFGGLHARVLLHKQDELIEMENKLNELDNEEKTFYYLSSRRDDLNFARKNLLTEIERKMADYGDDKSPSLWRDDYTLTITKIRSWKHSFGCWNVLDPRSRVSRVSLDGWKETSH